MTDLKPVLTWVNQEREKRGMEPLERLPKDDGERCPLSIALETPVSTTDYVVAPGRARLLPMFVRRFIRDFDNGKYPELVA